MISFEEIVNRAKKGNPEPDRKVVRSNDEWKQILTFEEYRITREQCTEPMMSSELCYVHEPGVYECVGCQSRLFDSSSKFDSGTGWPSFTEPLKDNVVSFHEDETYGMYRIEVRCNVCDAHLGHVFNDGPQEKGGVRYCINGIALKKV